ncbi:glycosyltransferase family 4 protein [Paenibacillus guangzhouensis]|uniref:glycosyltransferase family 4 protein n=1 Tax=Paenibacillus guangzhouensis TaxID=1473112 RepID=UPI0012678113|nr:glycosyltransferase family 4 protein [Paenibacillus guangzhouensis]
MKVNLIGPIPPPLGGISIHLRRLAGILEQRGISYTIYNESKIDVPLQHVQPMKSFKRFMLQIPFLTGDLFHFHTIDVRLRIALGCYKLFGKKIILTVHGESLAVQLQQSGPMKRKMLLRSLRSIDAIICVNEATTHMLLELGFHPERVMTLPAYIHPVERDEDTRAIPAHVYQFMESKDIVVSANGYVRFHQGEDLYGIDLLIEVVHALHQRGVGVKLLFAVMGVAGQSHEERSYYDQLKERIKSYQLTSRIQFYEVVDTEFYPILKVSDIFIRPTVTDGYGVTIAEALHYRVPSIASDVCARPAGTILYESRSVSDLTMKVLDLIERYSQWKDQLTHCGNQDYADELIAVYTRVAGKGKPRNIAVTDMHGQ